MFNNNNVDQRLEIAEMGLFPAKSSVQNLESSFLAWQKIYDVAFTYLSSDDTSDAQAFESISSMLQLLQDDLIGEYFLLKFIYECHQINNNMAKKFLALNLIDDKKIEASATDAIKKNKDALAFTKIAFLNLIKVGATDNKSWTSIFTKLQAPEHLDLAKFYFLLAALFKNDKDKAISADIFANLRLFLEKDRVGLRDITAFIYLMDPDLPALDAHFDHKIQELMSKLDASTNNIYQKTRSMYDKNQQMFWQVNHQVDMPIHYYHALIIRVINQFAVYFGVFKESHHFDIYPDFSNKLSETIKNKYETGFVSSLKKKV